MTKAMKKVTPALEMHLDLVELRSTPDWLIPFPNLIATESAFPKLAIIFVDRDLDLKDSIIRKKIIQAQLLTEQGWKQKTAQQTAKGKAIDSKHHG